MLIIWIIAVVFLYTLYYQSKYIIELFLNVDYAVILLVGARLLSPNSLFAYSGRQTLPLQLMV